MTNPFNNKPENLLERSLLESSGDESFRAEFYRRLLAADVHVVPVGGMPSMADGVIKNGEALRLQTIEHEGELYVAFYSSESRVHQANPGPVEFLTMSASSFFNLTKGSRLILNPGLPFCRNFEPKEIEGLLDGSVFGHVEQIQVQRDTRIHIGPPAEYPMDLVGALSRLFRRYRSVKKAYLAEYVDSERDPGSGLIIGVDLDAPGDWSAILRDSGGLISSVWCKHKFVDFILFEPERGGVSLYLDNHVKPFYERT